MRTKFTVLFIFGIFWLLVPLYVWAAELYMDPAEIAAPPGDVFEIAVFLSSPEGVNAIEGELKIPANILELVRVSDGNTIISPWISGPEVLDNERVTFSGIVPGGFYSKNGKMFSLVVRALGEGEGHIQFQGTRALLNDGNGSEAGLVIKESRVRVEKGRPPLPGGDEIDVASPEDFNVIITRDPNIFNGQWFLIFSTQDKGSGILHYEVQEHDEKIPSEGAWKIGESPYRLEDQERKRNVSVRAVDNSGNIRLVTVARDERSRVHIFTIALAIILLVLVFIMARKRRTFLAIVLFATFILAPEAEAADLLFSPRSGTYNVGDSLSVTVIVESNDQAMNAVSAEVEFPSDKLEVTSISSKSQSVISLWVREPSFSNRDERVTLEGIVLNPGYRGGDGRVASINFKVLRAGNATLSFRNAAVLANDGKGTDILEKTHTATYRLNTRPRAVPEPPPQQEPSPPPPPTPIPTPFPQLPIVDDKKASEGGILDVVARIVFYIAAGMLFIVPLLLLMLAIIAIILWVRKIQREREKQKAIMRSYDKMRRDIEAQVFYLRGLKEQRSLTSDEAYLLRRLESDLGL